MPDRLKIVVLSANYPGPGYLYGEVFVHSRNIAYLKTLDVQVVGFLAGLKVTRDYTYEDVPAFITPDLEAFKQKILKANPDVIVGHLISYEYFDFLKRTGKPVVVFVHGYEALSWRRRAGNYSIRSVHYLAEYIFKNTRQLHHFKKLARAANEGNNIHFVFVSEWLKKAATEDIGISITHAHVIPNPIDTERFKTTPKSAEHRKKILLIRSFKAKNYANDISVDAILALSKKPFFNELEFCIYGVGYLYNRLTEKIRQFPNVKLNNFFLENKEVPAIHEQYGIFLCPSRLDTQGVSMCEAMSSGLVPVTSPTGGIPEYAEDGVSAFFCAHAEDVAARIEYLYWHPEKFLEMSIEARKIILQRTSKEIVIPKELALITSVAAKN